MKVSVVIERDDQGYFAFCPELRGCHTQGPSLEIALERLREAVDLYVETLTPDERSAFLSRDILTTTIDVRVA